MPEDHLTVEYTQVGFSFDGLMSGIQALFAFFGFGPAYGTDAGAGNYDAILTTLYGWWQVYSIFALIISAVLLYGIIYARIRLNELGAKYHDILHAEEMKWKQLNVKHESHGKLALIEQHASSDNPNDWRLAIIEADIMLEELLEEHHIPGATIGERLKHMNHGTLRSLDDAWSAHKVRNEIAHKGGDFILTKRIAHETIAKYHKVFEELSGGGHGTGDGGHH
jgi:uncharacterized membrane protein